MADIVIRDFHAHIYYDAADVERARALAAEVQRRFEVAVGHLHLRPVGPHPRGSVQMTVPPIASARWRPSSASREPD